MTWLAVFLGAYAAVWAWIWWTTPEGYDPLRVLDPLPQLPPDQAAIVEKLIGTETRG